MRAAAALLLALTFGCAARQLPPAPPPPPPDIAGLQRTVETLADTCEQVCVKAVLAQCVLVAVDPYQFVSSECVGDKSRACLMNCTGH